MSKITFEFATKDDCLDKMVPSDLRRLVAQRDELQAELAALRGALKRITRTYGSAAAVDIAKEALLQEKGE